MKIYGIKISKDEKECIEKAILRTYPDVKYFDVIVDALDIPYMVLTDDYFGIDLGKIKETKKRDVELSRKWQRLSFFTTCKDLNPETLDMQGSTS